MNAQQQAKIDKRAEVSVRQYPQIIKYMGSKAKIIDFVASGIQRVYDGGAICDLFSGAASLAGALSSASMFVSNDIQKYSGTISRCYLGRVSDPFCAVDASEILELAKQHAEKIWSILPDGLRYQRTDDLDEFNRIESRNRQLISKLPEAPYTLFTRCYSGTWWSAEQCVWIDALRWAADKMRDRGELSENDFSLFLSALMHAMAYCSQGTGHFAQYRDAKTLASMKDISIYRAKKLDALFSRKLASLRKWNYENVAENADFRITSQDYLTCLENFEGGTIYADPPYAFVHYSRFYHALETLVLYDYPELQVKGGETVKGRYREGRHQSPFSIRSQVPGAFKGLFQGVDASGSNLVLSYSNSGLFELDELCELARSTLGAKYQVHTEFLDHKHMTMGRRQDRHREVKEALIVAQRLIR